MFICLKYFAALGLCLCLHSCTRYSFSVNDNLIYTPPPLYQAGLADTGLQNCLQQHIEDQQLHAAEELKRLVCSNSGIQSLVGLDRFSRIEELGLENNRLTEIDTLFRLPNLQYVDLRGNDSLQCEELERLQSLVISSSRFPQHCVGENP